MRTTIDSVPNVESGGRDNPALTKVTSDRSLLPERELHIEYEVEGHPHASEEGNCPFLGRRGRIVTHEEAAAEHAGGAK